jgi:hypothetical protein
MRLGLAFTIELETFWCIISAETYQSPGKGYANQQSEECRYEEYEEWYQHVEEHGKYDGEVKDYFGCGCVCTCPLLDTLKDSRDTLMKERM